MHTYTLGVGLTSERCKPLPPMRSLRGVHPVSVRRFPSFRTQPLENITPLPMNKWVPEQPSPWRKYSKRESCYGDQVYTQFGTAPD